MPGRPTAPRMAIILFCGAMAWLTASARIEPFDMDEIEHAHATWMVAQGFRPFTDFQEGHPPYLWAMFAPVIRLLPESFESLVLLRCMNAAFSALMLAFLYLLLFADRAPDNKGMLAGLAAILFMASHRTVAVFLTEFRPDQVAGALMLAGAALAARRKLSNARRWSAFGFMASAGVAINPKGILFALVIGGGLCLAEFDEDRARSALALACGGALGAGMMLGLLLLWRMDWNAFYYEVVHYHRVVLQAYGGAPRLISLLLKRKWEQSASLTFALLCGSAAVGFLCWRREFGRAKMPLILLAFSVAQLSLLVTPPDRQYAAVGLLALSGPLALFFELVFESLPKWSSGALIGCLLLWPIGAEIARLRDRRLADALRSEIVFGDFLIARAPRGTTVAAQPPYHPVFREDATYYWVTSAMPGDRAGGTIAEESAMAGAPALRRFFSYDGYLEELSKRSPSLIIRNPEFSSPAYRRAVSDFLEAHRNSYERLMEHPMNRIEIFRRVRSDG